jgi:hypothetical protein
MCCHTASSTLPCNAEKFCNVPCSIVDVCKLRVAWKTRLAMSLTLLNGTHQALEKASAVCVDEILEACLHGRKLCLDVGVEALEGLETVKECGLDDALCESIRLHRKLHKYRVGRCVPVVAMEG